MRGSPEEVDELTREFKQTDDPIRQHIAKVMMSFLAIIGVSSVFNENRTDTELFGLYL